jgi:acyl CoA:acetate/3-ketoacid CoA transferase
VSDLPPEIPNVTIRDFSNLACMQVSRLAASIPARRVHVPGKLVDYIVLSAPPQHPQVRTR